MASNCPNCGAAVAPDSPSCGYCGSALSVRVCPSCFGAVSVGMMHCPHCGARVVNSKPQKSKSLSCPRCERSLALTTVGKHSLHVCHSCGGLWLDRQTFQIICSREEEHEAVIGFKPPLKQKAAARKGKQRVYIPCPECGKLMNHKNFSGCSGIVLDWCRDHGNWFDRHELQRIVTFIRNGGLRMARERERSRMRDREARLRLREFQSAVQGARFNSDISGQKFRLSGDPLLKFLGQMFR